MKIPLNIVSIGPVNNDLSLLQVIDSAVRAYFEAIITQINDACMCYQVST